MALWDLSAERSDSGVQPAAALLAMEEPAVAVSCAVGPGHEETTIVALAQSGEAYAWRGQGVRGAAAAAPTRIRWGCTVREGVLCFAEGGASPLLAVSSRGEPVSGAALLFAR